MQPTEDCDGGHTLRFKAKIAGKEVGVVAAITPPVDVPEFYGTRGRVPVRGTINGHPYRSSLSPCGAHHMMPVNKLLLAGAGAQPGDMVRKKWLWRSSERNRKRRECGGWRRSWRF